MTHPSLHLRRVRSPSVPSRSENPLRRTDRSTVNLDAGLGEVARLPLSPALTGLIEKILEHQMVPSRGQAKPRCDKRKRSNYPLRIPDRARRAQRIAEPAARRHDEGDRGACAAAQAALADGLRRRQTARNTPGCGLCLRDHPRHPNSFVPSNRRRGCSAPMVACAPWRSPVSAWTRAMPPSPSPAYRWRNAG